MEASPEDLFFQYQLKEVFADLFRTAKFLDREVVIIKHRYQLSGEKFKTYSELSKQFNISKSRAQQIEARGLRRLRTKDSLKKLEAFNN